ncbi:hypothetical protein EJ04DRAFT_515191 [Polyplosphaeria fusca]|uniref:Uncharacterized protein n=1 Tax=Polyplosphaeria fusca TaxID=682080 RepID=A0A9P4UYX9_9PLEO|nr:hypothetical protein EJ04DRAFT_515191 [Polyplosphaeria fusca]
MASIYLNALVTLVAANARTVDEGFLVARKDIMKELPWIRLPFGHGEVFALLTLSDSFQAPELDPLRQRGWALQESLMSPRLLKFGSYNLGWECLLYGSTDQRGVALVREKHAMGPMMRQILQRPQEGVKGIGNQHWINREWTGTVEEYSRRRLTVHSDRLPAIAAVAEIYGRVSGYTHYFAGLWGEDFIGQLLWTTNETDASTGVYTAPSWSWASVDVAVEYPHSFFAYIDSCYLEILSCAIDRAVKALHFGEVTGGSLMVSGLLTSGFPLPLGMPKGRYGHTKISFDREESVAKDLGRVRFLHICDLHDRRGIGYGRDKYLSLGLMLEELSSPEDSFKRVGFFILHNRDVNQFGLKDWLGEAKRRRFSIL